MPFACALSRGRSFCGAGASLSTGGGLSSGRCYSFAISITGGAGGLRPTLDGNSFSLVEVGVDAADVDVDGAMLGFLPPISIWGLGAFGIVLMLGVIGNVGSGEATSLIGMHRCQ